MVRLMTYEQVDSNTVYIPETGGVFFGHTAEEVRAAAERTQPNYQSGNLSNVFSDQYFNFCLRKELLSCRTTSVSKLTTTSQQQEQSSPMLTDESGRSESSTDMDSSSV